MKLGSIPKIDEKKEDSAPVKSVQKAETVQLSDIEQERINNWKAKKEKDQNVFHFVQKDIVEPATGKKTVQLFWEEKEEYKSNDFSQKVDLLSAEAYEATGLVDFKSAQALLYTTFEAVSDFPGKKRSETMTAVYIMLLELKPKDSIEGMLCSRLVSLHFAYMAELNVVAGRGNTRPQCDSAANRGSKLMRLYNETLDTLMRYRRKGEQKVVVQHQHVNVHDGGQAVVSGQLNQGGGDHAKS